MKRAVLVVASLALFALPSFGQQAFGPGQFRIDGIPVSCGALPTVLDPNLNDGGRNTGTVMILNPIVLANWPTSLKLWMYAHECGHSVVGANETAADCWAIRTGRNQGWFPPQAFQALMAIFANNPGDYTHLPGPQRVQAMVACYSQP